MCNAVLAAARTIHHSRALSAYGRSMARGSSNQEPRVTTAVRLSESLHARLLEAATERDVSVNLLVSKAVDDFLGRLVPVDELVRTRAAPTPTTHS